MHGGGWPREDTDGSDVFVLVVTLLTSLIRIPSCYSLLVEIKYRLATYTNLTVLQKRMDSSCRPRRYGYTRVRLRCFHGSLFPPSSVRHETRALNAAGVRRMEESGTPVFSEGAAVEVCSDEPGFFGAWFEATVLRKIRKRRLSVEYDELVEEDDESKPLREVVDLSSVRPCPPPVGANRKFAVHDKVEAFLNDGWWVGEVARVVDEARYIVKFVDDEQLEIKEADLRIRLDWVDGQWVHPSRLDGLCWLGKMKRKKRTPTWKQSPRDENPSKKSSTLTILIQRNGDHGMEAGHLSQRSGMEAEDIVGVSDEVNGMLKDIEDYSLMDALNDGISSNGFLHEDIDFMHLGQHPCRRSIPKQLNVKDPVLQTESYSHYEGMGDQCSALIPYESGQNLVDDILKTELLNVNPSAVRSNEIRDLMGHSHDKCLRQQAPLLFVKKSSLWKTFESMEVFNRLPQNPHFCPLKKFIKEVREGLAIGLMVNFVNLVENMQQSQFTDPLSVFVERLMVVEDLEHHGFHIQGMHSHILEIIRLKQIQEQYERNLAELEGKILGQKQEECRLHSHMNEIDKKIIRLEKSIAMVQCKGASFKELRENCEFEHAQWEKEGKVIKEQWSIAKQEFDSLAMAPLFKPRVLF
ncbi:DUF724 domain-containing protein 8-like [Aristolochia californica]|uniref:DUF724 domain-containing protein 8-like n=1 Tax=Aristolochia californica TaxID=171875 RepID=UPI0035DBC600